MQSDSSNQEIPFQQQQEIPPVEISILCSLKASPDPVSLTTENTANSIHNNVVNDNNGGDDEFGENICPYSIKNHSTTTKETEKTNVIEGGTMEDDENLNTMMPKPLLVATLEEDNDNEQMWTRLAAPSHYICEEDTFAGNISKHLPMRRTFPKEASENNNNNNNNNNNWRNSMTFYKSGNSNYEENLTVAESRTAFLNKIFLYENESNWKRDRWDYGDFVDDLQVRFPWKRTAYIAVLLVLGVTCAILALMKLCGGAEWMNTATFSVIIMGTVMLLPPGLYYGRILICITCRCKGYTLWDVPAGPFG